MMRLEQSGSEYYKVVNPSPALQKYIKEHVSPKSKLFSVHWFLRYNVIVDFLKYAVSINAPIDFQCVPEEVMELLDQYTSTASTDPWTTLYLLKNAPDFVIDAVWKAFAKKYHPDTSTGNEDLFIRYKKAYDQIKSNK